MREKCCSLIWLILIFSYDIGQYDNGQGRSISLHQKAFLVELLSWRQNKRNGRSKGERGGEKDTLARKSRDSGKRPLIFHGLVRL